MGIFDTFKKKANFTTDNGVLGPTFFDDLTVHIQNPEDLQFGEWRRQLKTPSGQTKFKIKFYGQLHEEYQNLIIGTDFAPSLVLAVDSSTGEEILLFDGCKHGYDSMFCFTFTAEQITNRPTDNFFKDQDGNDTFEIVITTFNDELDEYFQNEVDENGFIELIDGTKMEFEKAKRNCYHTLQILVTNGNGQTFEVVAEELA